MAVERDALDRPRFVAVRARDCVGGEIPGSWGGPCFIGRSAFGPNHVCGELFLPGWHSSVADLFHGQKQVASELNLKLFVADVFGTKDGYDDVVSDVIA